MLTQFEKSPAKGSAAYFSDDNAYRYWLTRVVDPSKEDKIVVFIGLNPSTADAIKDDPTIRRCIRFARDWGYGRLVMLNLFAFRATDPKDMKAEGDPVGPENDWWLRKWIVAADEVVCAWGVHGTHKNRDLAVLGMIPKPKALGRTKGGQPRHPLYMPIDSKPQLF